MTPCCLELGQNGKEIEDLRVQSGYNKHMMEKKDEMYVLGLGQVFIALNVTVSVSSSVTQISRRGWIST